MPPAKSSASGRRNLGGLLWLVVLFLVLLAVGLHGPDLYARYQERQLKGMKVIELETLARGKSPDPRAHYFLGLAYARENRFTEAAREFRSAVEADPLRADGWNDLGVTYLLQDRYYESLIALQGAIRADPRFAPAYANLGRLHLATQMPFTAVKDIEKAVSMDPRNVTALADLGEALQRTQNFTSAEKAYKRALAIDPKHIESRIGLANTHYSRARYADARRELDDALAHDPDNPSAALLLGRVKLDTAATDADLESARESFERAGRLDDQDPDIRFELGRTLLKLRRPVEAVEALTAALRLSPEHMGALNQLERALRAAGRIEDADRTAKVFKARSLRDREETQLEEHISHHPEDWDARARLAELYILVGKRGVAALVCKQLQDGAPAHPKLQALLAALNRLHGGGLTAPRTGKAP